MNKLRILYYFFAFALLIIAAKLFLIQVIRPDKYSHNLYLKSQKIIPSRGLIYDRNRRPLVLNQTTYKIFAEPKKIEDKKTIAEELDKVLNLGSATIEAKINNSKAWALIKDSVEKNTKDSIAKLKIKGIGFNETQSRFYLESSTSAHLIGFVGKNSESDKIGYFGVEGYYNQDLAGLPGIFKTERDLLGNPIFIGVQDILEGEDGRNFVLTIDKTVQLIAKNKLSAGIEKYGAKEGCVIIANPYSMEILALTCLPDYDPAEYYKFDESFYKNPTISSLYEPGSIFKPLIMAAAINEGKIEPNDKYNETGPVKIGKYEIQTWDKKYQGEIDMTRILEKSSNVGMVYVGEKLGNKNLITYLKNFGIGEKTGIDLEGEIGGLLKEEKNWKDIDYATATFGQGISLTPIQMIRAFSSLVNGGFIMKPYVVSEIITSAKKTDLTKPIKIRRIISERTSGLIRAMLEKTVQYGEVKWSVPKGYRIGGKTGTAQVPIAGKYDPSKTIASFIGFAPVDKPKFIALVILREPATSPWGSETAAPLFFDLARELIVYYGITPN